MSPDSQAACRRCSMAAASCSLPEIPSSSRQSGWRAASCGSESHWRSAAASSCGFAVRSAAYGAASSSAYARSAARGSGSWRWETTSATRARHSSGLMSAARFPAASARSQSARAVLIAPRMTHVGNGRHARAATALSSSAPRHLESGPERGYPSSAVGVAKEVQKPLKDPYDLPRRRLFPVAPK